jgi:Flp pilus assembly pilin Flp
VQGVRQLVRRFVGNRRGQGLIEYVLIVTLVGCCLVAILGLASTSSRNLYSRTSSTISRQTSAGGYGSRLGGWSGSVSGTPGEDHPSDESPEDSPPDSAAIQASRQS